MKQISIDILRHLEQKPGLSFSKAGLELSERWGTSYTRMTCQELVQQGYLHADTSGKKGHALTLTDKGRQALTEAEAPAVTA